MEHLTQRVVSCSLIPNVKVRLLIKYWRVAWLEVRKVEVEHPGNAQPRLKNHASKRDPRSRLLENIEVKANITGSTTSSLLPTLWRHHLHSVWSIRIILLEYDTPMPYHHRQIPQSSSTSLILALPADNTQRLALLRGLREINRWILKLMPSLVCH